MDPARNFVWCWRGTKLHAVDRVSSRTLCGFYAFIDDSWRPCPELPPTPDFCGACSKAVSVPAKPARSGLARTLFGLAGQLDHALATTKGRTYAVRPFMEWMDKIDGSIEFLKRDIEGLNRDLEREREGGGG
jgi:hypothetical protein